MSEQQPLFGTPGATAAPPPAPPSGMETHPVRFPRALWERITRQCQTPELWQGETVTPSEFLRRAARAACDANDARPRTPTLPGIEK